MADLGPLFPILEPSVPESFTISSIPEQLPRRRRRRMEPIAWVRRELTAPDGTRHQVDVPVFGPPGPGDDFAPVVRRYGVLTRR